MLDCDVKGCNKEAVPCIKGWKNEQGDILTTMCKKHEKEWHELYEKGMPSLEIDEKMNRG